MDFFFVQDYRQKYRFFSSESQSPIQVEFSRLRKFWEKAKEKLMLLPYPILKQDQAFERMIKIKEDQIKILYSGSLDMKKVKSKFYFFLQKQRSKHIALLIGESLFLPISGVAAFLPGPNVFFYALALLMIVQWQALRGINRLFKKEQSFVISEALREWEEALEHPDDSIIPDVLAKIEKEHSLFNISKILWKKGHPKQKSQHP